MKKHVIAGAMYLVTLSIGMFLGTYFNSEQAPPCPEKVQSVIPVRTAQINFDRTAQKSRSEIIAETVSYYHRTHEDWLRASIFNSRADAEDFADQIQHLYDLAERFADISKTIEVNQLRKDELGFGAKELRQSQLDCYRQVILGLQMMAKDKKFTNRCVFEGGCMTTAEDNKDLQKKIQEWDIDPLL